MLIFSAGHAFGLIADEKMTFGYCHSDFPFKRKHSDCQAFCWAALLIEMVSKNPVSLRGRIFCGGPERDRTVDLRVANAALSQLSYKPILSFMIGDRLLLRTVVPSSGFICTSRPYGCEPYALPAELRPQILLFRCFDGARFKLCLLSQLSYAPEFFLFTCLLHLRVICAGTCRRGRREQKTRRSLRRERQGLL